MKKLNTALSAWGTDEFEAILKKDIAQMKVDELPLQQGLANSSYALDTNINAIIIHVEELQKVLRVKAGVFYTGIIHGCNCADDPSPVDEISEYCEIQLDIDKLTAKTGILLIKA